MLICRLLLNDDSRHCEGCRPKWPVIEVEQSRYASHRLSLGLGQEERSNLCELESNHAQETKINGGDEREREEAVKREMKVVWKRPIVRSPGR